MSVRAAGKKRAKLQRSESFEAIARDLIVEGAGIDLARSTTCAVFVTDKKIKSKGKSMFGSIQILSPLHKQLADVDLVIVLEEGMVGDSNLKALLHHLLCSVFYDDESETIKPFAFDFQGYAANIRAYGDWTTDLEHLRIAETNYQLRLLDK